jgi:uncharacterized iron-regulated membrane protein
MSITSRTSIETPPSESPVVDTEHRGAPRQTPRGRSRRPNAGFFRAFWRWHFYASFLVTPVLLILAVTGLIYLFRFQLEPLINADLMRVDVPPNTIAQPYAAQQTAVENAFPDATLLSMTEPSGDGRSTVFSIVMPGGSPRDVFVNPFGAEVLGSLNPDNTLSGTAVRLHANLMAGTWGGYVIELAACWAVVMAITGYFLFFRGRAARRRRRQAEAPGGRLRSTHALLGSVLGVGLLGLLVTGLPWTDFWGAKVQQIATSAGSSMWSIDSGAVSDPTSRLDESLPHSHAQNVPWALGATEVPGADSAGGEQPVANVDTAVAVADREGLRHPMTVALPGDERGVYSVIGYAFDDPSDERTLHVDRFDGEVVSTYGYSDYPVLAKVVAQGIGLHEGRSLGLASFWAAALFCLAVVFMCIAGPLMWWRRRPKRGSKSAPSVGAPRGRMPIKDTPALAVALIALGVFLPIFGLSLVLVLVFDRFVVRRVPRLADMFDAV